jgi:hypothetical protein
MAFVWAGVLEIAGRACCNGRMTRSDAHIEGAEQYSCADIDISPLDDHTALVYSRNTRSFHRVPAPALKLLLRCTSFKTLDEHAAALTRGSEAGAFPTDQARQQLKHLLADGLLIPAHEVLRRCQARPDAGALAPIATLAIPSAERPVALERAALSYLTQSQRYGRDHDLLIIDGSREPSVSANYQHRLARLQQDFPSPIRYGDQARVRDFAAALSLRGGIPLEVLEFALLPCAPDGLTRVGASRNAILLDSAGDLLLSVDDDTLCQLVRAPAADSHVTLNFGTALPAELELYPDRAALLREHPFQEADLLALHEQVLGQSLGAFVATQTHGVELRCGWAQERYLRQLSTDKGHIALTLNGIAGDCGSSLPISLFLPERSFARLTRSDAHYQERRLSREVLRCMPRVVVSDRLDALMTTFCGLDNRALLPPFMPLGRAEDDLFGRLLTLCRPGSYAAHLPWAALHAPLEPRGFTMDDLVHLGDASLPQLIWPFLQSASAHHGAVLDCATRLRRLGRALEDVAELPAEEFAELARSNLWRGQREHMQQVAQRLERDAGLGRGCAALSGGQAPGAG